MVDHGSAELEVCVSIPLEDFCLSHACVKTTNIAPKVFLLCKLAGRFHCSAQTRRRQRISISRVKVVVKMLRFRSFVWFAAYNCRYVTCDYNQWSDWSASCGISMRRTRTLSKVNERYIKRQGGCSGLKVTCDRQLTELKTTNCKLRA